MGGAPANPQDHWAAEGRWIDRADYEQLIDKLAMHPDPELVYVSGMISWHNQLHLGRCFRLDAGVPDRTERRGMYGFRFVDQQGRPVDELGLPVAWNHAEVPFVLPVTFFGLTLELPRSAVSLEIWNRGTGTLLGTLELDRSVPDVTVYPPELSEDAVLLRWNARDDEGSALTYVVLVSPNGTDWWPCAHGLTQPGFDLSTAPLSPGEYRVQVLALNSIRVGRSDVLTFSI